jgi:hypothetical protein
VDLCEVLESHSDKKCVLITHESDSSKNHFPFKTNRNLSDKYEEKRVMFNFMDRTAVSQVNLLEKARVRFQGKEMSFVDLVSEYGEELALLIEAEILRKIKDNEEIHIGKPLRGLGNVKDYYVPRYLERGVHMKPEIKEDKNRVKLPTSPSDILALRNGTIWEEINKQPIFERITQVPDKVVIIS